MAWENLYPFFPSSSRKIDGTRTPRDERRRAQHNEGKVRVELLGLTGTARPGTWWHGSLGMLQVHEKCLLNAGKVETKIGKCSLFRNITVRRCELECVCHPT